MHSSDLINCLQRSELQQHKNTVLRHITDTATKDHYSRIYCKADDRLMLRLTALFKSCCWKLIIRCSQAETAHSESLQLNHRSVLNTNIPMQISYKTLSVHCLQINKFKMLPFVVKQISPFGISLKKVDVSETKAKDL